MDKQSTEEAPLTNDEPKEIKRRKQWQSEKKKRWRRLVYAAMKVKRERAFRRNEIQSLLEQCEEEIDKAKFELEEGKTVAKRYYGLTINDSSILDSKYMIVKKELTEKNSSNENKNDNGDGKQQLSVVMSTTGGHSNTDHVVQYTGDNRADRISELKRALRRRARAAQPEYKGEERWDQPRAPGVRRRRIIRELDMPTAPSEPPTSGYVAFVSQMTTKIRHDRPNTRHDQAKAQLEIGQIWRFEFTDEDREYYDCLMRDARAEYKQQLIEFRATGRFSPSSVVTRAGDGGTTGPWVRVDYDKKNDLEKEIEAYDTVKFPLRPSAVEKPTWEIEREEAAKRAMEKTEK